MGGELVVDPFHRGQLLGLEEIKRRLAAAVGDQVKFDARVLRAAKPREILIRILDGARVPSIARELFVSQSTVRNQLAAIYRKIGVHSQGELVERLRSGS